MDATLENITVGRTWMMGIAYGAMKNDMYLQFCMPMARHLLQSVEIPQLTQVWMGFSCCPIFTYFRIGKKQVLWTGFLFQMVGEEER